MGYKPKKPHSCRQSIALPKFFGVKDFSKPSPEIDVEWFPVYQRPFRPAPNAGVDGASLAPVFTPPYPLPVPSGN